MYNCARSDFPSLTASWSVAKCWASSCWMGIAKLDVRSPGKGMLWTDPRACSISAKTSVIELPGNPGWDGDEVV